MLEVNQLAVGAVLKQLADISRIATKLSSGNTADVVDDAAALSAASADLGTNIAAMIADPSKVSPKKK